MSVDKIENIDKNNLYIFVEGEDYCGKEISENQKIYGQRNKSTNEFKGIVRRIDTENNSIYEGRFQNNMA